MGQPLPAGEVGELCVQTPNPGEFLGYWNQPEKAQAAVIGRPDPDLGEVVAAYLVLRAGTEPTDEFREELPMTPTGKIQRRLLRRG